MVLAYALVVMGDGGQRVGDAEPVEALNSSVPSHVVIERT
jgi:hypothetical protein